MKFKIENKDIIFGKGKSVKALCNKAKKLNHSMQWWKIADQYNSKPRVNIEYITRIYFTNSGLVVFPIDEIYFKDKFISNLKTLRASKLLNYVSPEISQFYFLRNEIIFKPTLSFNSAMRLRSLSKEINYFEKLLRQQVSLVLRVYHKSDSVNYYFLLNTLTDIRINYRKLNNLILQVESIEKDIKSEIDLIRKIDLKTLFS